MVSEAVSGEKGQRGSYNTGGCGFTARMGWCYRLKKTCRNGIGPVNLRFKQTQAKHNLGAAGLVRHLHTLSIMCATRRSEMPGQDSSARLKAFSSSSMAPTPPPLARRFSFSYRKGEHIMFPVALSFGRPQNSPRSSWNYCSGTSLRYRRTCSHIYALMCN